ncbi:flippase-like domain-containing protein [Candidatus Parcubacteria bacterium]|nr:flippase-like domain-containing protein [Patescibacteria group bacterium]MBU4381338.1 flippase-like domain-containing protein [Patescibacteria group bacterium]MCG2688898.1 flippase-like domain-containing protein [Candidatus Parcubacteria bacterium]
MRDKKGLILQIIGITTLLFIVFKDKEQFITILNTADLSYLPQIAFYSYLAILFSGIGFVLVARLFEIKVKTIALLPIAILSIVINNLMAFGGVAGFSLRIVMLKRYDIKARLVIAASLFHMYLYTIGITAFIPFSLIHIFNNYVLSPRQYHTLVALSYTSFIIFCLATIVLLFSQVRKIVLLGTEKVLKVFSKKSLSESFANFDLVLSTGIKSATKKFWIFPLLVLIVIADYGSASLALGYCFKAFNISLGRFSIFSGMVVGASAGIISMIPGGLGVQEASMSEIFKFMGVPFNTTFLVSLLFRAVFYLVPFALALTSLFVINRRKKILG